MLTSEYIKTIPLSMDSKETLAHTYNGLGILHTLLADRVRLDGTPLSRAIGDIDVLKGVILSMLGNEEIETTDNEL